MRVYLWHGKKHAYLYEYTIICVYDLAAGHPHPKKNIKHTRVVSLALALCSGLWVGANFVILFRLISS